MSHRFAIGDLVAFKVGFEQMKRKDQKYIAMGDRMPRCHMIVERWTQECHGGIQYSYRLGMAEQTGTVADFELMPWAEVQAYIDALPGFGV